MPETKVFEEKEEGNRSEQDDTRTFTISELKLKADLFVKENFDKFKKKGGKPSKES